MAQLAVLTSEAAQLIAFGAGQAIRPSTFIPIGLADPITDRLSRRFELPGQLLRRAARSNQLDHLLAELGCIRRTRIRHRGLLSPNWSGVHGNGSSPNIKRPAALDVDLTQAQAAIDAGEYDSAIAQLAAIISASPDSAEAYNRLGYVHRRLQNFDEAFANYGRALDIEPDHTGTHHYIGEAYLEVDDLEKAEYHLAQLNDVCEWGCDDFWKLKAAAELYQANVL